MQALIRRLADENSWLRDYVTSYNDDRVHTRLRDAPKRRPVEV